MRLPMLALLVAVAWPGPAGAQQWDDLVSIGLEGLDHSMTRNGAPYDKPASDGTASLRVRDGRLIGVTMALECQSKPGYQGAIAYSIKSGQLSSGGPCETSDAKYTWHVDHKWSSTASLAQGRLVLKGQGTAVRETVRGGSGNWCGPDRGNTSSRWCCA